MQTTSILIVDANHSFARVARQYLCRLDVIDTVELAGSFKEARQKWQQKPYRLILLDLGLTLNGTEFITSVLSEHPCIKVIGIYLFDGDLSFFNFPGTAHCDALVSRENFGEAVSNIIDSLCPELRGDADT